MKQHKLRRFFKHLAAVLWYGAVISLALLLGVILTAKFQGKVPRLFGYSLLHIVSGSMEPAIPTGTYILVEAVEPEDIRQGDVITFYSQDPMIQGIPNTHRVCAPPESRDGLIYYSTQGDANPAPDSVLTDSEHLIGRYVQNLDSLAALTRWCTTRGMVGIIVVIAGLSAGMMIISVGILKKKSPEEACQEDNDG